MIAVEKANQVIDNARATVRKIVGPDVPLYPGGGVWVLNGANPQGASWHVFITHPVDYNAAAYLHPATVDRIRKEAEALLDGFPASTKWLEDMGCDHTALLRKKIEEPEDALLWSCSIFNSCTPLPYGWSENYTNPAVTGIKDWPRHVLGAATSLSESGFKALHLTRRGRVAVLPVEGGSVVLYWAEPGSGWEADILNASSDGADVVLGPEHPLSVASYSKKGSSSFLH